MGTREYPCLRPLRPFLTRLDGRDLVGFDDPHQVAEQGVYLPLDLARILLRLLDGAHSWTEIQALSLERSGKFIPTAQLERIVARLDEALVLDGPAYADWLEEYRQARTRPAAFAGRSYAGTQRSLASQVRTYLEAAPDQVPAQPPPRGIVSPHIDFNRGGFTYAPAYRALASASDAQVFVIFGVAHLPTRERFVLTYKDFETPLGLARTDRDFVGAIAERAGGDRYFADEIVHRAEHSIEFQVVFLQQVLPPDRDYSIVPILVGSFHDLMDRGVDPIDDPEVRSFLTALEQAERSSGRPVAYIGGIDLGHVGPEFGDPEAISDALLEELRSFDEVMLGHACQGDPRSWFEHARQVDNRYRVCGLSATYTMLHAMGPTRGAVLKYDQAVHPDRSCGVSFASLAFWPLADPPSSALIHADSAVDAQAFSNSRKIDTHPRPSD